MPSKLEEYFQLLLQNKKQDYMISLEQILNAIIFMGGKDG